MMDCQKWLWPHNRELIIVQFFSGSPACLSLVHFFYFFERVQTIHIKVLYNWIGLYIWLPCSYCCPGDLLWFLGRTLDWREWQSEGRDVGVWRECQLGPVRMGWCCFTLVKVTSMGCGPDRRSELWVGELGSRRGHCWSHLTEVQRSGHHSMPGPFRTQATNLSEQSTGCRVKGTVQCAGCRVQGAGCRLIYQANHLAWYKTNWVQGAKPMVQDAERKKSLQERTAEYR